MEMFQKEFYYLHSCYTCPGPQRAPWVPLFLSGTGPGPGLDIHVLMITPDAPGSQGITLPDHPETEGGTSIATLLTDYNPGILTGILLFVTNPRIFLGRTPGDLPIPMRIITPDESAVPGKPLFPGWSLPLFPFSPLRNIWTSLTCQVTTDSFWDILTKWGRSYKDSQSMPWNPRLHRDSQDPRGSIPSAALGAPPPTPVPTSSTHAPSISTEIPPPTGKKEGRRRTQIWMMMPQSYQAQMSLLILTLRTPQSFLGSSSLSLPSLGR